ncbi:MAG: molybdenum cofactor guanylyltransferase [Synergistaceae bacterium]|nr:molybdenum cofactor guanylyltransferase [Synergistaceae bacterium]
MSASILAGGKSSRMGTDKALLEWREKNFLETILQTLSIFKNVMISTAGKDQYGWARCAKAPDLFPGVGPIGGIYSSLASSPDEYLFITACDTPFLSADLIKSICEAASGYQCFVAKERDGRLHPLCGVYHKSAISVLKERIERGRYKIAPAYDLLKTGYFDLSPSQAAELKNFNTKEEYLRMIESL